MLGRHFTRKSGPDLDVLRNEAVAAWIQTFRVDDRLEAFLDRVPALMRDEIHRSAEAIYEAASAFLETSTERGDIELDDFYPALHQHLQARFPWMGDTAFGALRAYTGWYSWHEGYLANGR
jgi:hypothetical protein